MKLLITLALLLPFFSEGYAQRVASDCNAPDSVIARYKNDVDRIAIRRILTTTRQFADTVRVPKIMRDSVLRPLLAVYNAKSFPQRDSVVKLFNIYTASDTATSKYALAVVDTTVQWANNLKHLILPTGNTTIDSLMKVCEMTVDTHNTYGRYVYFRLRAPINLHALAKQWQIEKGVIGMVGILHPIIGWGGPDIEMKFSESATQVIYQCCWPYGIFDCIYHRYWYFTVFLDCSVQFDSAYDDLSRANVTQGSTYFPFFFHPNPASDKLTVELPAKSTLEIVDVDGKILLQILCQEGKTEISVATLSKGLYFLRGVDKNGTVRSGKFIKE